MSNKPPGKGQNPTPDSPEYLGDEDRFFHYVKTVRLMGLRDAAVDDEEKAKFDRYLVYLPSETKTIGMLELADLRAMAEFLVWYRTLRVTLQAMRDDLLGGAA